MTRERIVLAYSGGLDTSCILKWLLEKKYNVICYMANIGQDEDFEAAKEKAQQIGATEVVIEDLRKQFVEEYVWPAIQAGLIYESRYLLGTSLARPCIAVGLVNCARTYKTDYISHGATGKGNDQVRFELSCYSLWPDVKIVAPWRLPEFTDQFQGRDDLLKYAAKHGIPVSATTKTPWSTDANLMHISYEAGILENPIMEPPNNLYMMTVSPESSPDEVYNIEIHFKSGLPVLLKTQENKSVSAPLEILTLLNEIGAKFGIGRIDIVENRVIGLKSRGVYETPGGHILHVAHTDLEVYCLDREIYRVKQSLRDRLSDYVYSGFWFSPEGNYVRECVALAEKFVSGVVKVALYKGNVCILGRSSEISLYNEDLVSMNKHGNFSPSDATGFINIHAIRLKEFHRYQQQSNK